MPLAAEVARSTVTIADAIAKDVRNCVRYSNWIEENPSLATHMFKDVYIDRTCTLSEITLIGLPSGARLLGGGDYIVEVEDQLIEEQYPVFRDRSVEHVLAVRAEVRPRQHVRGQCIMLARFGIYTWGHWLGEILPKAVLVEKLFPKRYQFVLPIEVESDASPDRPWSRILQSLAAYGITADRLVSVSFTHDTVFDDLFVIPSVWSDHMIHPVASEAMRSEIRIEPGSPTAGRVALRRLPGSGRTLDNQEEIYGVLQTVGFKTVVSGTLSFRDQVNLFRESDVVFATLGSDLSSLIFSPPGVQVITAAPSIFGDRFFYALILDRSGTQIDLRGPIVGEAEAIAHRSRFRLDAGQLRHALELLEEHGS